MPTGSWGFGVLGVHDVGFEVRDRDAKHGVWRSRCDNLCEFVFDVVPREAAANRHVEADLPGEQLRQHSHGLPAVWALGS